MNPSSITSPFSVSQYPAMAATPPMKMAVKTMSPLAASVAMAQITTPKNICCRTRTSSSFVATRAFFTAGRAAAHAAHARLVTACKETRSTAVSECLRNDVTEGDDVTIPAEKYIYMHVMKFHNEH
ncbi:hypothetical protein EYF80_041534 [Liparis tanakae]|uniref:Uncharacterized protein n=1 Tax=Liparis tanakae TaxID=230148 RepID=A0A4Z2G663_9TELE|nr:hypothetical protein EYF80_041534 [Liparis tanakae]